MEGTEADIAAAILPPSGGSFETMYPTGDWDALNNELNINSKLIESGKLFGGLCKKEKDDGRR